MRKFIRIITIFALILGLNGPGLMAIEDTLAFFSDTESGATTTFQAGTLDLDLDADSEFSPDISPGDSNSTTSREVTVKNTGSLDFQYQIKVSSASGTACSDWTLAADRDGTSGSITTDWKTDKTNLESGSSDKWTFTIDTNNATGTCEFDLKFDAWQDNLNKNQGFTDTETLNNNLSYEGNENEDGEVLEGDVVINEIMWMGSIADDETLKPDDEWIELYNTKSTEADIGNWEITNAKSNGNPINLPGNASISGHGYYLVARNPGNANEEATLISPSVTVNHVQGNSPNFENDYQENGRLILKDKNDNEIDQTPTTTSEAWPAGIYSTSSDYKAWSMERDNDQAGWHTCDRETMGDTDLDTMKSYWKDEGQDYNCGTPGHQNFSEPSPELPNIVLNEFLPNANDWPEYVELYNFDSERHDLEGYYIETADGTKIPINTQTTAQYAGQSTVIKENTATTGWMAVTTEGSDDLGNASDTLTLYTDEGEALDSVEYPLDGDDSTDVKQDKSIARIPDGTGEWVDPVPTPGGENKKETADQDREESEVPDTTSGAGQGDSSQSAEEENPNQESRIKNQEEENEEKNDGETNGDEEEEEEKDEKSEGDSSRSTDEDVENKETTDPDTTNSSNQATGQDNEKGPDQEEEEEENLEEGEEAKPEEPADVPDEEEDEEDEEDDQNQSEVDSSQSTEEDEEDQEEGTKESEVDGPQSTEETQNENQESEITNQEKEGESNEDNEDNDNLENSDEGDSDEEDEKAEETEVSDESDENGEEGEKIDESDNDSKDSDGDEDEDQKTENGKQTTEEDSESANRESLTEEEGNGETTKEDEGDDEDEKDDDETSGDGNETEEKDQSDSETNEETTEE